MERNIAEEYFMQSKWKMPACNHFDKDIGEVQLQYAQGVTFDGIPFEAEQWESEGSKNVTFIFPVIDYFDVEEDANETPQNSFQVDENIFSYHLKKESQYFTVLKQGMVMCEDMPSDQSLMNYVDYLVNTGLVIYASSIQNGAAEYVVDCDGEKVISVIICLEEDGKEQAYCPLEFVDFPDYEYGKKSKIKRIK